MKNVPRRTGSPAPAVQATAPPPGRAMRLLPPAVLALAILWGTAPHGERAIPAFDDAYITYRYVENAATGKGLVYNEGQRVFGCTSPLHLLWLLALRTAFPGTEVPELAVRSNAVFFAGTAVGLYLLLLRFTGRKLWALVGAVALAINPALLYISMGGMESFLFAGLVILSLWTMSADRPAWAGLLGGLAVLARPEAIVLAIPGILCFCRSFRKLLLAIGLFLAPVLAWAIFATAYYGTPIPLSLIAKARPLYPLPAGYALKRIAAWMGEGFPDAVFHPLGPVRAGLTFSLVLVGTAGSLVDPASRRRRAWLTPLTFWVLLALYAAGNPLFFEWYWPPVFVLALASAWMGISVLAERARGLSLRRTWPLRGRWAEGLVLAAGLLWLAVPTLGNYLRYGPAAPTILVTGDPARLRVRGYQAAAERLNKIAALGESVAAPEIGSLGFYYKGRILDGCGLISPEALPFLPVPADQRLAPDIGAISFDFIRATGADWVASMSMFLYTSKDQSDWFTSHYALVEKVPLPLPCWGSEDIYLFRKGSPPPGKR